MQNIRRIEYLRLPDPIESRSLSEPCIHNPEVKGAIWCQIKLEIEDRYASMYRPNNNIMEAYRGAYELALLDPLGFSALASNSIPPKCKSMLAVLMGRGLVDPDTYIPKYFLKF